MKKLVTILFFFFLILVGVALMLIFSWGANLNKKLKEESIEKIGKQEKKQEVVQEDKSFLEDQEAEFDEEEKEVKGTKKIEKKEKKKKKGEEKKEEKAEETEEKAEETEEKAEETEEKSDDKQEESVLDKKGRKGNYWVMFDYKVKEKEDFFEVTGSVYDADLYAEWVDEVGSDGIEEGEKIKAKDGLQGKNLSFQLPKDLRVGVQKIEWMEVEEKSVKDFLNGGFGSFLFENEGNQITEMFDWYMNYAG